MSKAKFIINSAITKSEKMNQIESIIGCLILNQIVNQIDVAYTTEQQNAMEEAACIKPGEYDFVTAVGGDGTVHDVINGIIESGSRVPVAVISTGTSNSFASHMNLPGDRTSFCKMIKKMKTTDLEVGLVNEKYFLGSVVGGFLTTSVTGISQQSKAVFGKMAYIIGAARGIKRESAKSSKIRFECKEFSKVIDTSLFVVKHDKGALEVLIIEKAGVMDIPSLLMKFMQGATISSKGIKTFNTQSIDISLVSGEKDFIIECDKESYGSLPIHVEPIHDVVKLIVP